MIVIAGDDHLLNNSIPATIARVNVMEAENMEWNCAEMAKWVELNSQRDSIEMTMKILKDKLKEINLELAKHEK